MDMKKLLIAEKSDERTEALLRRLSGKFEIHTCSRCDTAVALIDSLKPDVLFIDLTLPRSGGLPVLAQAKFSPPVCIARTSFISEKVLLAAHEAGIRHLFRIPCKPELMAACIEQYQ